MMQQGERNFPNVIGTVLSKNLSMCKAFCIFLIQETVEVQTLELAEVPVPGEGTLLDPLDVTLFLCSRILLHMLLL